MDVIDRIKVLLRKSVPAEAWQASATVAMASLLEFQLPAAERLELPVSFQMALRPS
jgi:hypothetical protein